MIHDFANHGRKELLEKTNPLMKLLDETQVMQDKQLVGSVGFARENGRGKTMSLDALVRG